jgi:hypothetical protein
MYTYRFQHTKVEDVARNAQTVKDELGWQDANEPEALSVVIGRMMDLCDLIGIVASAADNHLSLLRHQDEPAAQPSV